MTNRLLVVLAIALAPAPVFGIDGVVLINQSTVMAAGGFPYVISSPGSYKLSGNLTMITSLNGDYNKFDVAIVITADHVALDLNGFSITIVNNITDLPHAIHAIDAAQNGQPSGITIRNGSIIWAGTGTAPLARVSLNLPGTLIRVEDVSSFFNDNGFVLSDFLLVAGRASIARRVLSDGFVFLTCPSIISESIGYHVVGTYSNTSCASTSNADYGQ